MTSSIGRQRIFWRPFLLLLILANPARAQDKAEDLIREKQEEIRVAATRFHFSPRLLAGIVYAEQSLNVRSGEQVVDYVLARSGYNSSVGLAQVKVKTAGWVEEQLVNRESPFYLGDSLEQLIPAATSESERIERLNEPWWNIHYAAAYTAMIEKLWGEFLRKEMLASNRTGIIATLYSVGICRPDGSVRKPHSDPRPNQFGKAAQEFFDSFRMRVEFPS
ncbi:MAG: hypothetical protein WBD36_11720 [Bacteroidota bacterium]